MLDLDDSSLLLFHRILLFGTAVLAGGLNAVAGGGSFISFPMLIFTGVAPISANATNSMAMWVAGVASVGAYRQDLDVDRRLLIVLSIASLIGGAIGSIALLYTSSDVFKKLIPYLLLFATSIFILGEPIKIWVQTLTQKYSSNRLSIASLVALQLIISIYGGFFGAGAGILMLAALTISGIKNIQTMNALKALLGTCLNGIAIIVFMFAGAISWPQAILMSVGGALGSYVVARLARKVRSQLIRQFISIIAVIMTGYFFIRG
jgi:uncharacterized protein